MDTKEEYHDPDYPGTSAPVKEETLTAEEEEKTEKIKTIIHREFLNELEMRENEVMLIEQRMSTSRRMLHRLRYALVNGYYNEQKLLISKSQIDDDVAAQNEPRARAEVSTLLRDGQRRLHPSVRKLLGKQTADLAEIFKIREPRNKTRKDYSAMIQTRNYTIAADGSKTLRPEKEDEMPSPSPSGGLVKKTPRHLEPKVGNVVTLDEATRNKCKHRYRLVIGNTSKYAPPASRLDRSTHKWLLYVRGPPARPDPSPALAHVVARLHHSYAPAHTVHVYKPPFHISRRGWGEFPAQVELHFPLPEVNRPATVEHTIKLDRNYTGLQTLGAETIVDVWLYSTPEMLEFEYFDPVPDAIGPPDTEPPTEPDQETPTVPAGLKMEPVEYDSQDQSENWMEFFSKDTTELDVDEMIIKPVKKEIVEETNMETEIDNDHCIVNDQKMDEWEVKDEPIETDAKPTSTLKRIMKYIDSTTGKIYYLEMDRTLDLSKVQEIVINNTKAKISPIKSNGLKTFRKKKGGVSLLKPEVKNQLKVENKEVKIKKNFTHIENDHCYLGTTWMKDRVTPKEENCEVIVKNETSHYDSLCAVMCKFTCVKMAVNYLLKKIPLITDRVRDPDFVRNFPFVVESDDKYWKLDFAKRRNIEWSRAKLINKMLSEHLNSNSAIWRTKQILIYSRLHGFHPIRQETAQRAPETDEWSSWNDLEHSRKVETSIKEVYPSADDINSLTLFNSEEIMNSTMESLELTESDEEVDIVSSSIQVKVKTEPVQDVGSSLTVLPVESEEDRLRFLFVEKKCADIGVELRNEDVGNGYSYSAVHAVLLSAMKSFAEELLRSAAADQLARDDAQPSVWTGWSRPPQLHGAHVHSAARRGRLAAVARLALGTPAADHSEAL